jgi:carbon monoxide dehydrogenase subunit G
MKVRIEKSFDIAASPQATWELLNDLEATTTCMPGAKITERIDATHYKGAVTVKVGPATLSFRGDIEVLDVDPAARSLRLLGKGTDTTGSSAASMDLSARVEAAEGGGSKLVGATDTTMSGKAAAFGGRLMNSVADQILEQFAANFAARAAARSAPSAAGGATPAAPAAPQELDGLALAWAVFKNWLRRLFSKKAA